MLRPYDTTEVIGVEGHVWRHTRRGDKYITVTIDHAEAGDYPEVRQNRLSLVNMLCICESDVVPIQIAWHPLLGAERLKSSGSSARHSTEDDGSDRAPDSGSSSTTKGPSNETYLVGSRPHPGPGSFSLQRLSSVSHDLGDTDANRVR